MNIEKSAQTWFNALENLGENPQMSFGKINLQEQTVAWKSLPHSQFDGLGGILHLLQKEGVELAHPPQAILRKPGFLKSLMSLFYYLPESQLRHTPWIKYDRDLFPQSAGISWTVFDTEKSQQLAKHTRTLQSSVLSYSLWQLNRIVQRELQGQEHRNWWMIPVNLRGLLSSSYSIGNQVSYVSAKLDAQTTPAQVKWQVRGDIDRALHWAPYLLMKFFSGLGQKTVERVLNYYRKRNHCWAGIFTYVRYHALPKNQFWIGVPPVTRSHPIGAQVVNLGEQIGIALHFHPGLVDSAERTQYLFDLWTQSLMDF